LIDQVIDMRLVYHFLEQSLNLVFELDRHVQLTKVRANSTVRGLKK